MQRLQMGPKLLTINCVISRGEVNEGDKKRLKLFDTDGLETMEKQEKRVHCTSTREETKLRVWQDPGVCGPLENQIFD